MGLALVLLFGGRAWTSRCGREHRAVFARLLKERLHSALQRTQPQRDGLFQAA